MSLPSAGSTLILVALVSTMGVVVAGNESPLFKITTKRTDDNLEVKVTSDEKAVVSIHSPFGISNAQIERRSDKWPETVTLRLHLKGLELFRATNARISLDASVSSQNGKARVWKDGREDLLLDANSPYWLDIRRFDGDGKPATANPLNAGYFEMQLPKSFFEANPKSITVSWIDFYRN